MPTTKSIASLLSRLSRRRIMNTYPTHQLQSDRIHVLQIVPWSYLSELSPLVLMAPKCSMSSAGCQAYIAAYVNSWP